MGLTAKFNEFKGLFPKPSDLPIAFATKKYSNWDGLCGVTARTFTQWVRGWAVPPIRDYSTATRGGNNSGAMSPVPSVAPLGAYHWWGPQAGLATTMADGHVAVDLEGGGSSLGQSYGYLRIRTWTETDKSMRALGLRYRGWTTNYAGGIPNGLTPAGGGSEPIDNTPRKKKLMSFVIVPVVGGAIEIQSLVGGKRARIQQVAHVQLLQRLKNNDNNDVMFSEQLEICKGYLTLIAPDISATVDLSPVLTKLQEVLDGLPELGEDGDTEGVDLSGLLAAVSQVGAAVAAVPDKVADKQAERLKS